MISHTSIQQRFKLLAQFIYVVNSYLPQLQKVQSIQKRVDNDPDRQGKWWYSTFHTVTAMIGAGVLSLPYAMAYLGW